MHDFRLLTAHVKFHKICTLISFFCWKYIKFQLKMYRWVMSHDTEEWCKIWRKTDLLFQNWQELCWISTLIGSFCAKYIKSCIFFIVRNCSVFMGIIFCSSVTLVWTFNTRGVYKFITKEANVSVNLVPFFNCVSLLFCHFLKSRVTNELKSLFLWKSKKVRVIYSKQGKTLLLIKR